MSNFIIPNGLTNNQLTMVAQIISSKGKNSGQLLKSKPATKPANVQYLWDKVAARCLTGYYGSFWGIDVPANEKPGLDELAAVLIAANKPGIYLDGDKVAQRGLSGMGGLCYWGDEVNRLDRDTILLVIYAAKKYPYPLGKAGDILTSLPAIDQLYDMDKVAHITLGQLRLELTQLAQGSMNGIHDTYIQAACELLD